MIVGQHIQWNTICDAPNLHSILNKKLDDFIIATDPTYGTGELTYYYQVDYYNSDIIISVYQYVDGCFVKVNSCGYNNNRVQTVSLVAPTCEPQTETCCTQQAPIQCVPQQPTIPIPSATNDHTKLINKNADANFQHVTLAEKDKWNSQTTDVLGTPLTGLTEATTKVNLEATDTVLGAFGKIKKWFSSLKALAFKDKADYTKDIDNIPTDLVQDANYVHTDNNYTNADAQIVANTSGTNTGDQDLSGYLLSDTTLQTASTPEDDSLFSFWKIGVGRVKITWLNLIAKLNDYFTAKHEHTHTELLALCTANELKIGDLYLLTDYETTYTQPVTNLSMSSGVIEPLLLKASSVNTFETICSSALYPRDIISYDINDSSEGFTKGKIFRRNDTINSIDAGTDWRHVKYRRWELNVTTQWVQGSNYTIGDIVTTGYDIYICTKTHNDSGDVNTNFIHYPFGNGDFAGLESTGQQINIGQTNYYIPVSSNFNDRLKFGTDCFFHRWDGKTLDNIVIGDYNYSWTVGVDNSSWTIGDGGNYWTIGDSNYSFTIGDSNNSWTIGNSNNYWTIGDSNNSFTIGDGNYYWTIGDDNYSFTIGDDNSSWIIGDSFINYDINSHISNITPPNISENYFKKISKAGTKKILEYTDEFGDVNIIEL